MAEPVSDIKFGLKIWKYLGIARDLWEQIKLAPEQIAALEKRVTELESRLKRAPGEACPRCGELEFRVERAAPSQDAFAELGVREHFLKCKQCGFEDIKRVLPSSSSRR